MPLHCNPFKAFSRIFNTPFNSEDCTSCVFSTPVGAIDYVKIGHHVNRLKIARLLIAYTRAYMSCIFNYTIVYEAFYQKNHPIVAILVLSMKFSMHHSTLKIALLVPYKLPWELKKLSAQKSENVVSDCM